MPAWTLTSADIEKLQGGDGSLFRDFLNRLLRAHCHALGVPESVLNTDSRNMKDGGVDAEMRCAVSTDPCGRLTTESCWQYKAMAAEGFSEAKLREAAAASHVVELTKRGYAFRFCIADDLTAQKKENWENWMWDELRKSVSNAPRPQVLTSTDIKDWANRYVAVVLSLRPSNQTFQHLDHWKTNAVNQTPLYVPVLGWQPVADQLRQHLDFAQETASSVLRVHGDAGVGKTRFVFECLLAQPGARELVLYTPDDQAATNLTLDFIQQDSAYAILVVDECSLQVRVQLEDNLRGHKNRVRVVVIDNSNQRPVQGLPEPQLTKMSMEQVEAVLEANFKEVSPEMRRAAASLSGGFIRLAADFCSHGLDAGFTRIESYYDLRLPDSEDRKAVEAVALLTRVGFRDDVKNEFSELCQLLNLSDPELAKQRLKRLKDQPGFVALGGRFFYVTPEAIAGIAFARAWARWVEDDVQGFLDRFPPSLYESFVERVSRRGSPTVREAVAAHAQRAGAAFQPDDLADKKKALRFLAMVETSPATFLPRLRELIETLSGPRVEAITGRQEGGDWGLRRKLVWLCERLATFPEYFYESERILWRLAQFESEPGIGNNASAIWKQLFRIYLSGTATPYLERAELLKRRFKEADSRGASLVINGVMDCFAGFASRMGGPAVVSGRIPPPDWQPTTEQERVACYMAASELLRLAAQDERPDVSTQAVTAWIGQVRAFLAAGRLDLLTEVLQPPRITLEQVPSILTEIDYFLRYDDEDRPAGQKPPPAYVERVRQWRAVLVPEDFHSRVVALVGPPEHHHLMVDQEEQWKEQIASLAQEAAEHPDLMAAELAWFCSPNANGGFAFGLAFGALDAGATWLESVMSTARSNASGFAKGYLNGLAGAFPAYLDSINRHLDDLENADPELAYHLSLILPVQTAALSRAIRLYDRGALTPSYFLGFRYGLARQTLEPGALQEVLSRLLHRADDGDTDAGPIAVTLLYTWLHDHRQADFLAPAVINSTLRGDIARALAQVRSTARISAHEWRDVLKAYSAMDAIDAIRLACVALESQHLALREEATKFLGKMALTTPDAVMASLGELLLDEKRGIWLRVFGFGDLLTHLPTPTVMSWLAGTGVKGARLLASGLPRPFLNPAGEPVLPALTEAILQEFGEDEKVSNNFTVQTGIRVYSGDIAALHTEEAKVASRFLGHPLSAIRRWASQEKSTAEQFAESHLREEAERLL